MASISGHSDLPEIVPGRDYSRTRKPFYRAGLMRIFCAHFVGECDRGLYQEKEARI